MILLNQNAFLATGIDRQHFRKVDSLLVQFRTEVIEVPHIENVPAENGEMQQQTTYSLQGTFTGWVTDPQGDKVLEIPNIPDNDPRFAGQNLLTSWHQIFIDQLTELNPTIQLTKTV